MTGIRVDANDRSVEPLIMPPVLRIEEDLHPVTDLNLVSHLLAASPEQDQPEPDDDCDRTIDRPLWVTCHKTAGQDIDSLQHPDCACHDEQAADNME